MEEFDIICPMYGPDSDTFYAPYPPDCGKYFVCDNGTPVLVDCPGPLHWNNEKRTCDWPDVAGCQQ